MKGGLYNAYCRKCGAEIDDEAVICPKCGVAQKEIDNSSEVSGSTRNTSAIAGLGGFLPPVGWILWASMDKNSLRAKDLLIGNIIGTVLVVVVLIAWPFLTKIAGVL